MKVALVHDWLIHMRGGEKVLEALAEIFPEAPIYTLFCDRRKLSPSLRRMKIRTSWLQRLPGIRACYRWLLPILPFVIRAFEIEEGTDLVISSSHCVAKGVRIPAKAYHLCYCHTPARYLWGFEEEYFGKMTRPIRRLIRSLLARLRKWDLETNQFVDHFIANSENVRKRIRDYYGRDATVVYPPADTARFKPSGTPGNYYLVVSAFVPYKRVDLVIEAFNTLDRSLVIVGAGPLNRKYRRLRKTDNISFLGSISGTELQRIYAGARALIFPAEEDFGIVPVEAQACGTPVIAYGRGGALESVRAGIFFSEQTPGALRGAVAAFEDSVIDREKIPACAARFDKRFFKEQVQTLVSKIFRDQGAYAVL